MPLNLAEKALYKCILIIHLDAVSRCATLSRTVRCCAALCRTTDDGYNLENIMPQSITPLDYKHFSSVSFMMMFLIISLLFITGAKYSLKKTQQLTHLRVSCLSGCWLMTLARASYSKLDNR